MKKINEQVGKAIRHRRVMLGLSQEKVADLIGLTFQQIQKYEKGSNSMSIPRLIDVASALDCNACDIIAEVCGEKQIGGGSRADLEMMKRFKALRPYEQVAIVAFLNKLNAGRNEASN